MRALLNGERVASPLMMGALVGMSAIAVAALFLAVGYRSQFVNLKHVIYARCQARDAYDEASQKARAAQRQWFVQQISTEQTNRFIDAGLRAEPGHRRPTGDRRVGQGADGRCSPRLLRVQVT